LKGKIEMVYFLIRKGANLNAKDIAENAPLRLSLGSQFYIISEMLIDNGADLHVLNEIEENLWLDLCQFNINNSDK